MSFSENVKKELSQLNNYVKKDELNAELYGYMLTNNVVIEQSEIRFTTKNEDNIYRYNKILKNLNIDHEESISGNIYITKIKNNELLKIEIDDNTNILGAIVRGCFMGGGSINNPESEYHLEILFRDKNNINEVSEILDKFDINIKVLIRKDKYAIYMKDGEMISRF